MIVINFLLAPYIFLQLCFLFCHGKAKYNQTGYVLVHLFQYCEIFRQTYMAAIYFSRLLDTET